VSAPSPALLAYLAGLPPPVEHAAGGGDAILETPELQRIRDAPREAWEDAEDLDALVTALSAYLRAPGGSQVLKRIQAAALRAICERGSCFIPLRTGGGKTLITFLAPEVCQAKRPLLVVPAKMINKGKTHREHAAAQGHWRIRPLMSKTASRARSLHAHGAAQPLRVVSYEALGRVEYHEALENWSPDLIMLDEFHKVKDPSSGVTRQLSKYVRHRSPIVVPLSGTPMNRKLREFAHVLRWALKDGTPLPKDWHEMHAWGFALDEKVADAARLRPGALMQLAPSDPQREEGKDELHVARSRFASRLRSTPSVIASGDDLPGIPLTARVEKLEPTAQQLSVVNHLRTHWETPCGHPFEQATELWAHEQQVSCDFYYRWRKQPPPEWLLARRTWSAFVRETLAHSRTLYTPLAVANAIDRGQLEDHGILNAWRAAEPLFKPKEHQEAVWVGEQTLEFCAKWLAETKGLCWVYFTAFGKRLQERTGLPYFAGGAYKGVAVDQHDGPAIVSIKAVNEGFNLQTLHSDNLIATCPTTNKENEQLISRTHRDGQEADEVTVTYLQTLEGDVKALDQARADAVCVEAMTRQPQRLCAATWIDE
jgi:hypothetical protein